MDIIYHIKNETPELKEKIDEAMAEFDKHFRLLPPGTEVMVGPEWNDFWIEPCQGRLNIKSRNKEGRINDVYSPPAYVIPNITRTRVSSPNFNYEVYSQKVPEK